MTEKSNLNNLKPLQETTDHFDPIEDLLQNPFGAEEDASSKAESSLPGLQEAEILARRQVTNERIVDQLPEHRQQQARELSQLIDEADMTSVIAYGANAQKKMGEFSRSLMQDVRLKDTGEVGDILTDLMHQLEATDPASLTASRGLFGRLFGKVKQSITESQIAYQKISNQLDRVAIRLDREKNTLLNDNMALEQLYQKNKDYFEALNIYIAAGELKLEELQQDILPEAIEAARQSNNQMDVQKVHDLNQFLERLDMRVHDLRLTRQMTIQQAPQIRMIQNTNQTLAEKIQVSINTAIPLWENQVAIAMTLLRQQDSLASQRQVTETTNNLLLKNSQMLKQSAIETAHEQQRGVIDIDTLKQTQHDLIESLETTLQIQAEGRKQRQQAELDLQAMEQELHDKLLAISQEQKAQQLGRSDLEF